MPELSIREIAALVGGEVVGEGECRIRGVAPLDSAGPGELSLVANARYLPYVHATSAAALLVSAPLAEQLEGERASALPQVRVADPHGALALLLPLLYPEERISAGVHPSAVIAEDVVLGEGVSIAAHAVIERGTRVGAGARIGANTTVGVDCEIGAGCDIGPNVTLYRRTRLGERCVIHAGARLGADGFGFAFQGGGHQKVPQVGRVVVGDDVEIGANSTVDRGSIGDTVIGRGTKIDNLVHIGHNCRIGEHVLIIAQVGISGSTTVGTGAVLGGQVGTAGHITIGAGARIGAQAGVTADVPAGETVSGYPARPHREALRAQAALFKLPELQKRVRELERALSRLSGEPASTTD